MPAAGNIYIHILAQELVFLCAKIPILELGSAYTCRKCKIVIKLDHVRVAAFLLLVFSIRVKSAHAVVREKIFILHFFAKKLRRIYYEAKHNAW